MLLKLTGTESASPIGEPTPLLVHLAGPFASRVAGFWRAPHAAFVTATAERRHLVCLALSRAHDKPVSLQDADALLHRSFGDASRLTLKNPPAGLHRALAHIGEHAWSGEDYAKLLSMLETLASAKALRHADAIEPDRVRVLVMLPPSLLRGRLGLTLTPSQGMLLRQAYDLIRKHSGEAAADRAASHWATISNLKALFEQVLHDSFPEFPAVPFAGTARLKPIRTKAEMRDAALRFKNCLRREFRYACTGESVYFEWVGEPGAIVQLWKDPMFGWRLNEAKRERNAWIPLEQQAEIIAELRSLGVSIGHRHWEFEDSLRDAHDPDFELRSEEERIADLF